MHLVGILFPHINDDTRSKSHQIYTIEVKGKWTHKKSPCGRNGDQWKCLWKTVRGRQWWWLFSCTHQPLDTIHSMYRTVVLLPPNGYTSHSQSTNILTEFFESWCKISIFLPKMSCIL